MPEQSSNAGRFQPGRSGNPKGRPRKTSSVGDTVREALAAKVIVNENGKRRKISKQLAAATQLANKSAGGDVRASKMVFDMAFKAEERQATLPVPEHVTASDREIVERLIARLRLTQPEISDAD